MAHEQSPAAPVGLFGGSGIGEMTARQWYVLIVLSLVYAINIADRYVISTVMESIKIDLHVTDGQLALLTGTALAVFYVLAGIPISALADRYSRRNIISAALVIWSALTVFTGMSRNFAQMFMARVGVGVGESGGTPPSTSMLADWFWPHQRTFVLTFWALGASLGAWIGADVAGRIADAYGWRTAFYAMGVPGLVMGILIFLTIREPQRGAMDGNDTTTAHAAVERAQVKVPMITALKTIISQPATMHLMMGSAVTALWGWGLMWWTPTFLQRTYHLSAGEAGQILGPMYLIAGSLATVGTGLLMATSFMTDPKRVLWLMAVVVARGHRAVVLHLLDRQSGGGKDLSVDFGAGDVFLYRAVFWSAQQCGAAAIARDGIGRDIVAGQYRQPGHRAAICRVCVRLHGRTPRRRRGQPADCTVVAGADRILGNLSLHRRDAQNR